MRSPDASLIRARAKAPLPDLLALHLSSSNIECIKHLEPCKSLQSLYADDNHIKDIEGVIELRRLWRIDLSGNLLHNLSALASFRSLGFLYLERNRICFEDLVCLRDEHILEIRLHGNPELLKGNTVTEYRKKVIALLPNVWILDGHFISTPERQHAVEELDSFLISLLEQCQNSKVTSKFGSATAVWVDSEIKAHDVPEFANSAKFIQVAHKRPLPNEPADLRRLQAIISFHNAESVIHNTHCHFTPSKHNPNARQMPRIWLDEVLALPRRPRFEMIILLATFVEFHFPKVLLTEALTIQQLDCPHFPSEAIRDTVNLPTYALVALLAVARHRSLDEEQSMRDRHLPEVTTHEFNDEREILGTIPPVFATLLGTTAQNGDTQRIDATTSRCRRALKLLINVASFPDPDIMASRGNGKRGAILQELAPLLRAAESVSSNRATPGGREVVVPCYAITKCNAARDPSLAPQRNPTKQHSVNTRHNSFGGERLRSPLHTNNSTTATSGSAARRRPRIGDWVEVFSKQFVKIQFLSDDGQFVVGAVPTDSSRTITIAVEQLSRTSSSVWRVNLTQRQQEELTAQKSTSNHSTRLGKLHRDSEGFHHHGAARNQGFPNHFVTADVLKDLDRQLSYTSEEANHSLSNPIEVFSSNDTLDANYVLASSHLISAQNYCAINTFHQQRRPPAGLWSPMKQAAPYSVLATTTQPSPSSLKELKTWKPPTTQKSVCKPQSSLQPDDWMEIRREMQAQLGIVSNERPMTSSKTELDPELVMDDANALTTTTDADATAPAAEAQHTALQAPSDEGNRRLPQHSSNCRPVAATMKLVDARGWHQVATKTEFVVAASASLGASHSAPVLRQTTPQKATPEARTTTLKLHETVMLPSLNRR